MSVRRPGDKFFVATDQSGADAARHLGLYAYNVACKFFPDRPALVEEAVQEALTRTCQHWQRANRHGKAEARVVTTTTNVFREKVREESRAKRPSGTREAQLDPGEDFVRRVLLADALERLTRRQRLVVVWRYVLDRSVSEAATELGLTESKVRDATHNGVRRLRVLVGDQLGR